MSLHTVVLAGGSGTRFWPLSRTARPKQFLPLVSERSLLAETVARVQPISDATHTWVVCGEGHAQGVREALPGLPADRLVIEPAARNTAPAIGLAAVRAQKVDPEAVLAILPSDHHVADAAAFRKTLEAARTLADAGDLVTLGIQPARPETGYGYLKAGASRGAGFAVDQFVEKPDHATAVRYLADGGFWWNAGIFVFRADAVLRAIQRHLPAVAEGLQSIATAADSQAAAREIFPRLPSISIDYGVMEPESKEGRIAMVPARFGWSDVGSFAALPEVRQLDGRGNAVAGDALAIDCDGCVVLSEGKRLIAAVGLKDLCIVDSGDAVLVVPREKAQDVRKIVEALKSAGRTDKL